ncbi:MAG TPA: HupE/UreJ family protein [Acidobacteriota bacterium]|nr:HupE/UreJ family protein [Acidobacteriota bacterium]
MRGLRLFSPLLLLSLTSPLWAHEVRPGYLELREVSTETYEVLWKQPARGEVKLRLSPAFPPECKLGAGSQEFTSGALLTRTTLTCDDGLAGKRIGIDGLQATLTDVLVRVYYSDGTEETHLLRPASPVATIGGSAGSLGRAGAYLILGIEHILLGVDHLLFVLGLLLIVADRWMLLKTITSFTVAHSITLAIATLGYASAPLLPLNAAIALSILFLGPEIVKSWRGETSLTIRHPWVVAFLFGLLHGFGFATGLTAMGLPAGEIPVALLLFNLGVEAGQILFVALVLLLERSFRILEIRWPRRVEMMPGYVVGSLGAYWSIQRVVLFFAGLK